MFLTGKQFKDKKLQEVHQENAYHIAIVGLVCMVVAIFFNKGELIPFPAF
jgi:ACR3 family arsenite efflux pump ArsB